MEHSPQLRRMLSAWLGRVMFKRVGISEKVSDVQDLQEVDAMLEERAAEWKDEYIRQGVLKRFRVLRGRIPRTMAGWRVAPDR